MPQNTPSVRVIVRLPWNRPENAEPDPPHVRTVVMLSQAPVTLVFSQIEWTQEKADILWKVIEKSRSSDSGGADCMPHNSYIPDLYSYNSIQGRDLQHTSKYHCPTSSTESMPDSRKRYVGSRISRALLAPLLSLPPIRKSKP